MVLLRLVAAIILLPLCAHAADFGDTNVDRLLKPPGVAQQQPQPPPQMQAPEREQQQQAQAEKFPLIGHPFEVQYNNDPKLTYDIAYLDDETIELKPANGDMQPLQGQYTAHEIAQHLYVVFFYFPQIAQSVTHIYDLDHGHVWANITRINTGKSDEEFRRDPLDLWGMQGEMRLLEKK